MICCCCWLCCCRSWIGFIESARIVGVALKIYGWSIKISADTKQRTFPQISWGTAMELLVWGFKPQIRSSQLMSLLLNNWSRILLTLFFGYPYPKHYDIFKAFVYWQLNETDSPLRLFNIMILYVQVRTVWILIICCGPNFICIIMNCLTVHCVLMQMGHRGECKRWVYACTYTPLKMDNVRKLNTLTFPVFVFILLLDTLKWSSSGQQY